MDSPTTPKKQSRLSRILKTKKDKSAKSDERLPDSAYESSEADPQTRQPSNDDIVPYENRGQIPGVNKDQNLVMDKTNGEIVDEDTGEVVTTVTTTTTTTTTTSTSKGGRKEEVVTVATTPGPPAPPVDSNRNSSSNNSQHVVDASATRNGIPTASEMPADSIDDNAGAVQNQAHQSTHHNANVRAGRTAENTLQDTPPVPSRSPKRASQDLGRPVYANEQRPVTPVTPTMPSQHNFSYPRQKSNGMPVEEPVVTKQPSQIQNLKAAAVGLHGVGETLRGTFNDTVDRNFPRKNANKATKTNAKNQAVIDAGRNEIKGANLTGSRISDVASFDNPVADGYSQPPVHQQAQPVQPIRHTGPAHAEHPTMTASGGVPSTGPSYATTTASAAMNPDNSGTRPVNDMDTRGKKSFGLSDFLKRKPVAAEDKKQAAYY